MENIKKIAIAAVLAISVILSSCSTIEVVGTAEPVVTDVADIHLELTLLSRNELKALFGDDENPFIDYPGKIPRQHIMVFKTLITTQESEVQFNRKTSYLNIPGHSSKGLTHYRLDNVWKPYYNNDRAEAHMKQKIKKYMKPEMISVTPETPFEGYLAFLLPVDNNTEGTVFLQAETSTGDEGEIEIPFRYRFDDRGFAGYSGEDEETELPEEKNTGIFSEDSQ